MTGNVKAAVYDLRDATRTGVGYIPGLDGLRALSVLLVMFAHYGFGKIVPGGLGVTIFFFISGMLITTLLMVEGGANDRIDFGRFYMRRLTRLMPELFVFLAFTTALAAYLKEPVVWAKLLAALFYFYNYYSLFFETPHSGAVIWPHLWSLAIEEHFYLTYPIALVLLFRRPRALLFVLAAILAASLAWRCVVLTLSMPDEYSYRATETRIDSIAYGCLFALLVRHFPHVRDQMRKYGRGLFAFGLLLLVATLAIRAHAARETIRYSLQGVALIGIFGGLYCWPGNGPALGILEFAPLRWMGRVSYGAYLWHFVPMHLFGLETGIWATDKLPYVERAAFAVVAAVMTFGLAGLSFNLVLRQVRGLRRRFGSHAIH